jgi:acetyl-CoA C-acetyltransferase
MVEPLASVIGVGAIPVGAHTETLEHEMLIPAFLEAIGDASVTKQDIEAFVLSTPRPYIEQKYFATFMASYLDLPIEDILTETHGNGMSGALAFDVAVDRVAKGHAKVAIALGVSKETHITTAEHLQWSMRMVGDVDFHTPFGMTSISWYAMNGTRYMHDFGVGRRELAEVAVKNRWHASLNPLAQFRDEITVQDVLDSRPIVRPLHLLDVPPRSDGAAVVIVARPDIARSLRSDPVHVLSRGHYHEGIHQISTRPRSLTSFPAAIRGAQKAYDAAGIGPADIDFAEVYAPCSIVEVILSEALGFFPEGEGWRAALDGRTRVGGDHPMATSGGCTSRGHPPMATPLYNVVEAVRQLRGGQGERQVRDARIGLTTAELGDYNATLVHILGNEEALR